MTNEVAKKSAKGLLYVLYACVMLGLVLGASAYWLATTPSGLRASWQMAVPLVAALADIRLEASQIDGRLIGPLQVRDFRYQDAYVDVVVDTANIAWQPRSLLLNRVQIDKLSAHQVQVKLLTRASDAASESSADSPLPVSVHITQADVSNLLLQTTGDAEPLEFSDIQTAVSLQEDRVIIKQLAATAFHIQASAEGFISWQGDFPMALDARVLQPIPDAAALRSHIVAAGNLNQFSLQLDTAAPYPGELKMRWQAAAQGYEVSLQGPFEPAPLLVALGQLPNEALTTGPVSIDAQGLLTGNGFEASRLQLQHQDASLNANGRVDWSGTQLRWSADAKWQQLALPPWQPQLHSASGKATASGSLDEGQVQFNAHYNVAEQAAGKATVQASWNPQRIEISQGELAAGDSRLQAQGSVWPRAQLNWSANSPDLAELLPAASGQIKGQGEFSGDWLVPRIVGTLQASKLRFADIRLDKLTLNADLDLQQDSQGFLTLDASGLELPSAAPASAKLDIKGKRSAHQVSAAFNSAQVIAAISAKGGWAGGTDPWLGTIHSLDVKPAQFAQWQLQTAAALQVHSRQISLGETCLVERKARLCLQGSKQAALWQTEARLTQLPLELLAQWLPDGLGLNGQINAQGNISGTDGQWQNLTASGEAQAQLSRTDIADKLDLRMARFQLSADPQRWHAEVDGRISDSGQLKLNADIKPHNAAWQNAQLRGNLQLKLPKLSELALIAPEIEQLRGQINGNIEASGTVTQPRFSGRLTLQEGLLDLRDYGISISPLAATLTGQANGRLGLDLTATSEGGTLQIQGESNSDILNPALSASIKGERFLAARTDEATLYISPDLKLSVQNQRIELSGDLDIPEARLQPGEQQAEVQTISGDQILISDVAAAPKEPLWMLIARVRLLLGDKVFFKGMGVDTRLTGKLDIRENPGKPTIANGEIRLEDGAYEVYGQKLDIDTGRLIFANAPITTPAIDLKASREPRPNIEVGVRVRGLLDAPEVKLFSTPSMRQAEQLSYLILGRPLEGNEGNPTLASAALALGLNQGDKYLKGISSTLNVDEIGIETTAGESAEQASLVVGKYLSPRLYVSYGAGLFEPLHKLRMRYRMSEHWTLTGESGTAQGADILYTIER